MHSQIPPLVIVKEQARGRSYSSISQMHLYKVMRVTVVPRTSSIQLPHLPNSWALVMLILRSRPITFSRLPTFHHRSKFNNSGLVIKLIPMIICRKKINSSNMMTTRLTLSLASFAWRTLICKTRSPWSPLAAKRQYARVAFLVLILTGYGASSALTAIKVQANSLFVQWPLI
jgi:hypothetical protein